MDGKIADCDKLVGGVISGGRLPCSVFCTCIVYSDVRGGVVSAGETSGDNVVLLATETEVCSPKSCAINWI